MGAIELAEGALVAILFPPDYEWNNIKKESTAATSHAREIVFLWVGI